MRFSEMLEQLKNLPSDKPAVWKGVAIDSRQVKAGDLFVAIPGERVDGHDYIDDVVAKGAVAILAEKPQPAHLAGKILYWEVPNSVKALGTIAMIWRQRFNPCVIGITGSCGKTTVKGMLGSILSLDKETLVTEGNFNSQFSLPLMILRLNQTHQYAVIEMGASAPGDIAYLAQIAKPDIGIVTNVAAGHLKDLGTIEQVAETKGAIYDGLPDNGIAMVNADDAFYDRFIELIGEREKCTFGLNPSAMVTAKQIEYAPFDVCFQLCWADGQSHPIRVPLPGQHTVMNALAASAIALQLNVAPEIIAKGLAAFNGMQRRMQKSQGMNGVCVVDDTYNANPLSMRAAIDVLAGCEGEKILVMGVMAELGPDSEKFHHDVGVYAREKGINRLMAVGDTTAFAVKGFQNGAEQYSDKATLLTALKPLCQNKTTILVKGSRSAGMDEISDALITRKEFSC